MTDPNAPGQPHPSHAAPGDLAATGLTGAVLPTNDATSAASSASPTGPDPTPDPPATHNAPPSLPLRLLTWLVFDPLIALFTTLFGLCSLTASLWDTSGRQQHRIARLWARTLLRCTFSPVTVLGADHLTGLTTAVFASNHLSYMDTPVLFAKLPFQFRILAKQSLWKVPFVGWHLHRSGQVPVDQTTARTSIASLNRGIAALRDGHPLVVFPEGGRTPDGQPHTFLAGAAFMALRAQVPLVPVTLVGTYELLPMHTYTLRPRPLLLILGEPIPTTGLTTRDADRLTQQALATITATYFAHTT